MNLTFSDWSEKGYLIIKGSKSIGKDKNGKHLFSNEQVKQNHHINRYLLAVVDMGIE